MQDRLPPARQNPLATHGRTIHPGQKRRSDGGPFTSGLPRSTDILRVSRHVSNVHTIGLMYRSKRHLYSITSSARSGSDDGIVHPPTHLLCPHPELESRPSLRGNRIPKRTLTYCQLQRAHFEVRPIPGLLFLSRSSPERQILCPSSVSLFDLKARFFVPTRGSLTSSRAGAVKVGRRAELAACSGLARPYLDSSEHDGTLGAIGMTFRGEPAFRRGSVAPQPCIRWVQGPEP